MKHSFVLSVVTLAIVLMIASSIIPAFGQVFVPPASHALNNRPAFARASASVVANNVTAAAVTAANTVPPLYNIWSRVYTPGANSKTLKEIQGGSNGAMLSLQLQTTANPLQFQGDIYLDVDRNPSSGLTPLVSGSKPFLDDIGAEYVVHLSTPGSARIERTRDGQNVGTVAIAYDLGSNVLQIDIPTDLIDSFGDGNVNFGVVALGLVPEAIPALSEYDQSPYDVKMHGLRAFSTGMVTLVPSDGTLLRHGYLTQLNNPSSPSIADVTVMLESIGPVNFLSVRYIVDGQDATGFVQGLRPTQEVLAFTNDDFVLYGVYEGGAAFHFKMPDVLFPGPHTFTVVFVTDRGTFTKTSQWFVRTVYGPGDAQ